MLSVCYALQHFLCILIAGYIQSHLQRVAKSQKKSSCVVITYQPGFVTLYALCVLPQLLIDLVDI